MSKNQLSLSENISGLTSISDEFTPPAGKDVYISNFVGTSQRQESVIILYWDYEGAGEKMIWSTDGSQPMPFVKQIDSSDVDGIKKIAIELVNNSASNQYMSGYCDIEVVD